jgi:A/G-specific adenine glycosylase
MIFSDEIIKWYHKNKRDLPWRNTTNPYKIWISEIILQQTKVSQGFPYYISFIDRFPTITDLANASEDQVLKVWQGLGYYSRARNLHFSAKIIRDNFNCQFPSEYKLIRELRGVGDYTAAAISSFCYNLPYAVLDGNVSRVLSRYFAIDTPIDSLNGKKKLKALSQKLLNKETPSIYNQAIMEFGALMCTPKKTDCSVCPLRYSCKSFGTDLVELLPIKSKSLKITNKHFNYLIILSDKQTYLQKRTSGIWNALYQFPLIEGELTEHQIVHTKQWKNIFIGNTIIDEVSLKIKHKLSHQLIFTRFYHIKCDEINDSEFLKINWSEIEIYPLPILIDKYIKSVILHK